MKKLSEQWEFDSCDADRARLARDLDDERKSRVFWSLCDRMEEYACNEMLRDVSRDDARRKRESIARIRGRICSLENAVFELAEQAMKDAVRHNSPLFMDMTNDDLIDYWNARYGHGDASCYTGYQQRESSSMLYVFPDE